MICKGERGGLDDDDDAEEEEEEGEVVRETPAAAAGCDSKEKEEEEEAGLGFSTPPRADHMIFCCSSPDCSTTPNLPLRAASTQSQSAAVLTATGKYYEQPQHEAISSSAAAGHRLLCVSSTEAVGDGIVRCVGAVEGSRVQTAAAALCRNHHRHVHRLQPPPPPKKPKARPGCHMRWKSKVGHQQQNGNIFFNPPDLDAFFKAFTCKN